MATVLTGCCSTFVEAQTATAIPANLAASHIGEYATVEGVVAKVFTSKSGNTLLNIGASYPNQTFTGWIQGKPGWYELNGQIGADGTADLRAGEITAFSKYNFTQSKKALAGRASRYSYQVAAQFDSRRGTGHSTDGRPRIFTFVKE